MSKGNFSGMWNGAFEWLNIHTSEPEYDPVEVASIMAQGHTQDKAKEIIREKMSKGFFRSEYKVFPAAGLDPAAGKSIAVIYRKTP